MFIQYSSMIRNGIASMHDITEIAKRLVQSKRILFITGAGLSADSGLPTYRGTGGLYNGRLTEEGLPIEKILSGDMIERRPELVWKYFLQVGRAVLNAKPNRGHEIIADFEKYFRDHGGEVWTATQNIDGYHRFAGSQNLLELHGTMHRWKCPNCLWKTENPPYDDIEKRELPPRCPECHAAVRTDVVLFGELLPDKVLQTLREEMLAGFDVVFAVGTSASFSYITSPIEYAAKHGALTVEINPQSSLSDNIITIRLPLGAADALERIWQSFLSALQK
jgi:NAD-dependent deacetylase